MTKPHVPMPGYRGFKAVVNRERAEATVRTSQPREQQAAQDLDEPARLWAAQDAFGARKGCCHEDVAFFDGEVEGGLLDAAPVCMNPACQKRFVLLSADAVGEVRRRNENVLYHIERLTECHGGPLPYVVRADELRSAVLRLDALLAETADADD